MNTTRAARGVSLGRLTRPAEFEQALSRRPCAKSAHFAVHHVEIQHAVAELSTAPSGTAPSPVDDIAMQHRRLGLVVPKKHARRAATRNLVKRELRLLMRTHAARLAAGDWVWRLRAPIDTRRFTSASSPLLREALRGELQQLVDRAAAIGPPPATAPAPVKRAPSTAAPSAHD